MKLTANFDLWEFEASQTATRLGIDNRVPSALLDYVRQTAEMMQRIRNYLSALKARDVPITITSGYRCLVLNRTQGSKDTSDHVQGMAADWRAPSFGPPIDVCRALLPAIDQLEIGQLINEYPDRAGWVHTSIRHPDKLVNRIITITASGTHAGVTTA